MNGTFKKVKEYEGTKNDVLEDETFETDRVILKWDGCVDYCIGHNGVKPSEDKTGENTDYIHICDINEMIEKLKTIKEFGKKHFENDYWK